jgi:hypothetical protein
VVLVKLKCGLGRGRAVSEGHGALAERAGRARGALGASGQRRGGRRGQTT